MLSMTIDYAKYDLTREELEREYKNLAGEITNMLDSLPKMGPVQTPFIPRSTKNSGTLIYYRKNHWGLTTTSTSENWPSHFALELKRRGILSRTGGGISTVLTVVRAGSSWGAAPGAVNSIVETERQRVLHELAARRAAWFDDDMEKLNNWVEDKHVGLKADLEELDEQLKTLKREIPQTGNLPDKLTLQWQVRAERGGLG